MTLFGTLNPQPSTHRVWFHWIHAAPANSSVARRTRPGENHREFQHFTLSTFCCHVTSLSSIEYITTTVSYIYGHSAPPQCYNTTINITFVWRCHWALEYFKVMSVWKWSSRYMLTLVISIIYFVVGELIVPRISSSVRFDSETKTKTNIWRRTCVFNFTSTNKIK